MKRPDWRRVGATSQEVALTVGAVLGTVCLLFLLAGLVLHVKPLIVRSGSMEPTIATGALALSHTVPATDLEVGQIVSVKTLNGTRVTHRIVEIQPKGAHALLTLKGDANGTVDQQVYDVGQAERVVFDVPYAGYVVAWTSGRAGVFLGGLLAGGLVLLALRSPSRRPGAGKGNALGAGVALVLVGTVLHGTTPAQDTGAYFSDDAGFNGVTAASYTVPAPTYSQTCALGTDSTGQTVAYTWPANAAPTLGYDITISPIVATSAITDVGTDKKLTISFATPVGNRNKLVTVTGVGYPTAYTAWKSNATTTWKFRTNGNNQAATCGEIDLPVLAFTAPVDAASVPRNATSVGTSCAAAPACGTRTDVSAPITTQFDFRRTVGATTTCWNNGWNASNCSTQWRNATVVGNNWSVNGTATAAYGAAGSYTLSIQVTDNFGNVTTQSITFTVA
ncbi:signal peptidase I [Nocardioides sp. LS1]|uniref:signal peptidase I n=1 Tax=Nocardioides sp. LS1 TaxID=1027620 RepID=UPI000FF91C12|nr:signal peptidase I [Nocardioides sp. LS1]GCD88798.1 hypothetical protein NLS1_08040 [Nocardioides sp. LS1]